LWGLLHRFYRAYEVRLGQSGQYATRPYSGFEDEQFIPCPLLLPQAIPSHSPTAASKSWVGAALVVRIQRAIENGVNAALYPFTACVKFARRCAPRALELLVHAILQKLYGPNARGR
jgi:hypothetical protein